MVQCHCGGSSHELGVDNCLYTYKSKLEPPKTEPDPVGSVCYCQTNQRHLRGDDGCMFSADRTEPILEPEEAPSYDIITSSEVRDVDNDKLIIEITTRGTLVVVTKDPDDSSMEYEFEFNLETAKLLAQLVKSGVDTLVLREQQSISWPDWSGGW